MRQMTLFELEPTNVDINAISEEEAVRLIGGAVGLNFINRGFPFGWVAGDKKLSFSVHYSNYSIGDKRRFIACGYDYHKNGDIGGSGRPCDTIEEAIVFFRKGIERWA